MNLLLDTHSFIWFVEANPALSPTARQLIEDPANDTFLSLASIWEMAIKVSTGKLNLTQPIGQFIPNQLAANDISFLEITVQHALHVATLPFHHRDPFDRILAAQSLVDGIPLISGDVQFDRYGVNRFW